MRRSYDGRRYTWAMPESNRLPPDLAALFSGRAFRSRSRAVLPFLTVDPEGFPRAALLTFGEVRAISVRDLVVAVKSASRTAANLIRRKNATLLYLARNRAVWVQASAGRGRTCDCDLNRQIFPLTVVNVKVDRASSQEKTASLAAGPIFSARAGAGLFSEELFEELGRNPQ